MGEPGAFSFIARQVLLSVSQQARLPRVASLVLGREQAAKGFARLKYRAALVFKGPTDTTSPKLGSNDSVFRAQGRTHGWRDGGSFPTSLPH